MTAALLDSLGRFIANVGVPAAIAFFILYQITPRLDQLATLSTQANTQLTIIGASCARPIADLSPRPLNFVPLSGAEGLPAQNGP
jgi:hypothetical protein